MVCLSGWDFTGHKHNYLGERSLSVVCICLCESSLHTTFLIGRWFPICQKSPFDVVVCHTVANTSEHWVNAAGEPLLVDGGVTVNDRFNKTFQRVIHGEILGDVSHLVFRDPAQLRSGQIHSCCCMDRTSEWSRTIPIHPYFQHFKGQFKDEFFYSDLPPPHIFKNNLSCKPFVAVIQSTLLECVAMGALSCRTSGAL